LSRDVAAVVALQPEFVRFDGKPNDEALAACLQAGIAIEVSDIDTTDDFAAARAAGISFGLGKLFGEAESDCRPTHSKQ
jgi:phosphoglycolate phosphatase-like HAD superfamily hydrolase